MIGFNHEYGLTDTLISTVADGSPSVLPITLDYAKLHIRALGTVDDPLINVWIQAAASYFEEQTGRAILTQTHEVSCDRFPFFGASGMYQRIELPKPPLQSVTSVKYIDCNGALQSYSTGGSPDTPYWTTSAPAGPYARRGFVEPLFGNRWPTAQLQTGSVRIRYVAGYGSTPHDVPTLVRGILCYLVAHFDTFRSAVHEARRGQVLELPYGVEAMLDGFKYSALPSQTQLRAYATFWPLGSELGGRVIL